ncbi:MAG: hypothetical protein HFH70_11870 [Lachnospiraceae bacterium]|nr:hypothetical protein [Lachnospiraceae bacterium]
MKYTETWLWKNSLDNPNYGNDALKEQLKDAFSRAHNNASYVLDKIRVDFPSLTVHDITHVDGLWQVGSVIAGEGYSITPLEGFVLGCAFLMHDAVLSYEAAGGQDNLRETIEWKDYYSDYKRDLTMNEEEQLYETDFKTIRFLHAKYAEKLYCQLFNRDDGSKFYIIEDGSLRSHLGEIICKIAASHHWDIDEVEKLGIQFPAPSDYPREWGINPLKLACILRCADAGHIDAGRAPDYLLKLLDVNGISRNHWEAQNRLSQIDIDKRDSSKVIIRSNIKFKEEDFAAWNVVYDAIRVLDHEIKSSNVVLNRNAVSAFQSKGVSGAESQEMLCKYIETEGWMPCDANIHVSNIENLIKNLGGEKLYGTEHKLEIVIRELIQNARDAIAARRKMEFDFDGKINISIERDGGKTWVTVKDDGVGMSLYTIKDYFLNFGSSFWASDLSKREYPGLNSSGFKSVGCFGIGFYAIFMVASEVIVETRRYDKGLDDALVLKFPTGLCLRPIISQKRSVSSMVSTNVRFSIDESKCQWNKTMEIKPSIHGEPSFEVPYSTVLANLTAGLDVDVFYSELGESKKKIHVNIEKMKLGTPKIAEWLKDITYARYRFRSEYTEYIDKNYMRVRKVIFNDTYYGMAALNTLWQSGASYFDVTTIGGLSTFSHDSSNGEFLGCLLAEPDTAKRDGNVKFIDKTDWAKEQYSILQQQGLSFEDKLYLPYILGKYGVDMTDEMVIRIYNKDGYRIEEKLKDLLCKMKGNNQKLILPLSGLSNDRRIEYYLDYERTIKLLSENELLFRAEKNSNFLNIKESDVEFQYNIMHCINVIAEKHSLVIDSQTEDNKAFSTLIGLGKVFVLNVS